MEIIRRIFLSLIPFLIILAVLLSQPEAEQLPLATAGRAPAGSTIQPDQPGTAQEQPLFVSEAVTPALSPAVRDLPQQLPEPQLDREVVPRQLPPPALALDGDTGEGEPDPLLARPLADFRTSPTALFAFEGLSRSESGYYVPPDTIGDAGPNHYVQMVNAAFAVFDKSGNRLSGPTTLPTLFAGKAGTPNCAIANDGDPVVVYDGLADRWLLSQFFGVTTASKGFCLAVSQTPDPSGAYFLYEFVTPEFPDYFKIGVWPDAYYISANESTYTAYALDRNEMLAGNPATFQRVSGQSNLLLPADLDGAMPPPNGAPGLFYTYKDNTFHGGSDRLEVFAFDVDWNNPGNTTFTANATIDVAPFTYTVCGFFQFECIPQQGSSQRVDAISEWPMWRLQYRNFGTYETLLGNFTVDVGADHAGIRWFELRKGGGTWTLYQEGTHAPDSHHRWLGSIAMNGKGEIALGYSVSSGTLAPSIRYAVRQADDPPGSLQGEATLQSGSGAQISGSAGSNRWGDYSALVVDPADDCTFWYANEYYADVSLNWRTRVGVFKLSNCSPDLVTPANGELISGTMPTLAWNSLPIAIQYQLQVDNHGDFGSPEIDILRSATDYTSTAPLADGSHYWRVRGQDYSGNWGAWSSEWSFEIDATPPDSPTLVSPADGDVISDTTPTLDWNTAASAVQYQLQLDNDNGFSSPGIDVLVSSADYTTSAPLTEDTHYWRVRARDSAANWSIWSSVWSFEIDATPPGSPTLVSPTEGEVMSDTIPSLNWTAVTGAVEYQLQVDDDGSFGSPEVDLLSNASNQTLADPLSENTHYWRVRARDSAYNWGAWSSEWSFQIDATPPDVPTLVSPANGEVIIITTPTLTWTSSSGALGYRLELDGIATDVGNVVQFTTEALGKGTHEWTVAAYDAAGNVSTFVPGWSFEIDVVGPDSPLLLAPSNGAIISDTTPTMVWDVVANAIEYQLQVDDDGSFGSPEIDLLSSATAHTPTAALAEGSHYWRVRGRDNSANWGAWSAEWSFEIDVIVIDSPTLLNPLDGQVISTTIPTFAWNAVMGAGQYQLQVDGDGTFGNPALDILGSSTVYTPTAPLSEGTHYWRVRAQDSAANWSAWSGAWSFELDVTAPEVPALVNPIDGDITRDSTPLFDWSAVVGGHLYRIQISNRPTFSSTLFDEELANTFFVPGSALSAGTYYWRVQARDSAGNWSQWSPIWSVEIIARPDFQILLPLTVKGS